MVVINFRLRLNYTARDTKKIYEFLSFHVYLKALEITKRTDFMSNNRPF